MQGGVNYNGSTLLTGGINVNTTGNIQALNVQITENGERTITPPEGVDGYTPITIDTNVPIPEPVLDTLNVTSNGTYTPPSGVDGYDEVNVNVPQPTPVLDDITITANGTYTPPSGVDGYDEITVNVSQEADIQPLTRTITTNGTTIINASDLNADGFDPVTITTAVDGYTIKTLANTPLPIASFSDGTSNPLKSLTASIVPMQAGSGDPSPTNVRPISGWTEETITVTDDLQNPTVTHTTTIPFTDAQGNPVEVYGGSVDVINGKVKAVAKYGLQPLTNWNWVKESVGGINYRFRSTSRVWDIYERASSNCISSVFTINRSPISGAKVDNTLWVHTDGLVYIYCDSYTDATEFKEFVKDTQLLLPRTTPIEYNLSDVSISTVKGTNNIWASTGDVEELKYFADL